MSKEYLDKAGLTYLWSKLKAYFQVKLVSGTNIKTVNNNSLLGSGNISIAGDVTGVKGNAESSYRTGNVNLTAANVGAAASSHTHGANDITKVRESEITWGNKDFRADYSVGDVFLNDYLRANRFSGLRAEGITIEHSHDNGATWIAYETTDLAKRNLFTINGDYRISGSTTTLATASDQLRITVDTGLGGIYSYLNKFHIYVSTNGSNNCTVSIDAAPSNDMDNFNTNICTDVGIAGWSGWNVIHIPFSFCTAYTSQSTSTNYRKIRFLFKHSGITGTTYNGLQVLRIFAFGGVGYSTPSSMALTGHAYTFNGNMDVTFPAVVTATEFKGNVEIKQSAASTEDDCIPTVGDRVQFFRTTTTATGADGHVIGFTWSSPTKYGAQLYIDTDPTYNMSIRQRDSSGEWKPWKKIFTANDAIPVANGGTGQTSVKNAANSFMNSLDTGSSTPVDADYYISQYVGGGTTTTTYHRRPVSALWEYMKGKISSVLGLTATQYGGNAATATNASKVNSHTVNADVPANAKFTDTITTATTTGNGNAVTAISASNGALTVTKGTTFLTSHQDISGKADKATTLAGYGITDAKIANGVITLGSNTITPLTSHQDISGKADKSATVSTVTWDSTNKKFTKTINGTTTDIVTAANLRTGLNVADGAEVNQNAFSNVTVGSTTIAADSKTDTLTLTAGDNVTLTPDATNDKITIAATDTTYESKAAASGGTAVSLVTTGEKYTWNNKSTVPTNHASSATTYGTGTSSNYGHLKLSDSTSSTSGTSGGIAATPSAVKSAYDLANTANTTANTALSGVNGNLIYDHTFSISNGVATFTPHVYQKGAEVTTNYAASCFTWKYRLIDGSEVALTTKSNRGCDVTISNLGYGGHVIGSFTPPA